MISIRLSPCTITELSSVRYASLPLLIAIKEKRISQLVLLRVTCTENILNDSNLSREKNSFFFFHELVHMYCIFITKQQIWRNKKRKSWFLGFHTALRTPIMYCYISISLFPFLPNFSVAWIRKWYHGRQRCVSIYTGNASI